MVTVMKIIDLSHTIAKTTPVFPGSEKPQLATVASYEKDGYRETLIRMYSHTVHTLIPGSCLRKRSHS